MKTPDRCRTGTPPSAEYGPTGLYFGVSCYRRPTIRASPTTFHTVSEGGFCEVRIEYLRLASLVVISTLGGSGSYTTGEGKHVDGREQGHGAPLYGGVLWGGQAGAGKRPARPRLRPLRPIHRGR